MPFIQFSHHYIKKIPKCIQCVHFVKFPFVNAEFLSICGKYTKKNTIVYVHECRKDETKCGLVGNDFILKK